MPKDELDIYNYCYGQDIKELKEWVDRQIAEGRTTVRLEIEWGYYSSITNLNLSAENG